MTRLPPGRRMTRSGLAQLHLSPVAAHVRLPERLDETSGLALQRRDPRAHELQLLDQRRRCRDPIALDGGELLVHGDQRLADRAHQLGDGGLTTIEIALHPLGGLLERGLGERRERLAVGLQRLGGHRAEGVAEGLFGLGQDRLAVVGGLQARFETRDAGARLRGGLGDLPAGPLPQHEPCHRRAGSKGEQNPDGGHDSDCKAGR
jgi:hypothetical protein